MKKVRNLISVALTFIIIVTSITTIFVGTSYATEEYNLKKVLLVQNTLPWECDSNTKLLNELLDDGYIDDYDVCSTDNIATYDIYSYSVIMLSNDQTSEGYNGYMNLLHSLEMFANFGGVVVFGACDEGWGGNGTYSGKLPGGVEKENYFSYGNSVADSDHPIVTGALTTPHELTESDLNGNYCSHTHFLVDTLPVGTNIILEDDYSAPTLIEYPFGDGYVIASGLTWEYYYTGDYSGGEYAFKAFDDLIVYALALSDVDVSASHMEIGVDNNSFRHNHYSFFGHNEGWLDFCKYTVSDEVFNKLMQYYNESWYESLPFVKNSLQEARDTKWGGSCLGLSLSEALAFTNRINLYNFTGISSSYYDLGEIGVLPYNTSKFMDLINYYQLSQHLDSINKVTVYENNGESNLSKLVPLANKAELTGEPFIITIIFKSNGKFGGHALTCVGCEETQNNDFRLRIIDVNDTVEYNYLTLKYDNASGQYKSVSFDKNYTASNGYEIYGVGYYTLNMFDKIDIDGANNNETPYATDNPSFNIYVDQDESEVNRYTNDSIHLFFDCNDYFKITDADTDEYFEYKDGDFYGTLEVLNQDVEINGEESKIQVDIAYGENYVVTPYNEELALTIASDYVYTSFITENADVINYSLSSDSLDIEGDNVDYKLYMSYNENNDMQKISGTFSDEATFVALEDGIDYSTENNTIHDIVNFSDENTDVVYEEHIDNDRDGVCDVCGEEVEIEFDVLLGDVNGDGKVSVIDAKWVLQVIANTRVFDDTQIIAADVNGDKKISVVDAKWILQIVAGTRV